MRLPVLLTMFSIAIPALAVDYRNDILPIMKERCWECHANETKVKGNLALDDFDEVRDYQIGPYNIIRPGNAEESNFFERLLIDTGHTDFMPRNGERIPKAEIELIEKWIDLGAIIDRESPTEEEAERMKEAGGEEGPGMTPSFHTWENRSGKRIEAQFISKTESSVTIRMRDGKQFTISFGDLSEESVVQAKSLN